MTGSRILITTVRNEGPFLLEWIAYHRLIGFDHFLVFSAPSEDGTEEFLDALQEEGLLTHIRVPNANTAKSGYRINALSGAHEADIVRNAEWVMVLDIDEFLTINVGDGKLDALLESADQADLISLMWRGFGNGGHLNYKDELVIQRFVEAAPIEIQTSRQPTGIKTLCRPDLVERFGVHRPTLHQDYRHRDVKIKWIDGAGTDCTELFLTGGWAAQTTSDWHKLGTINHYRLRSNEVFILQSITGFLQGSETQLLQPSHYQLVNTNHQHVKTASQYSSVVAKKIAKLKTSKNIAMAHEESVLKFQGKIDLMRANLEVTGDDQGDLKEMLSDKHITETRRAQHKWMAARFGHPPLTAPTSDPAILNISPRWLADLRRSKFRRGFYKSEEKFALQFTQRDENILLVSFDNLSSVTDPGLYRDSWGYSFYRDEGWSHLGVLAFENNWYRDEMLFDQLEQMKNEGFFEKFETVVFCGTSMGAYAATVFCDLAPGSRVLAFSPQSTLDKDLVPWEKRFSGGRRRDWSGRYRDAAKCGAKAEQILILYDPYFEPDRRHAERYKGSNTHLLKSWYSSHKSALFMKRADLLKTLTREIVQGLLSAERYYELLRGRRDLLWYYNGLADHLFERNHTGLAMQLSRFICLRGHHRLSKGIADRAAVLIEKNTR